MSEHQQHDFAAPPPGQGSSLERICKRCGQRRSVALTTACPGTGRDATLETVYDYDPHEEA